MCASMVSAGSRRKNRRVTVSSCLFFILLVVSIGIPHLVFSQSHDEKPAKDAVDDIMSRLVKISEHGDLKDDRFFGEAMGIKMIGYPSQKVPFSYYACGISPEPISSVIRYRYIETPDFLVKSNADASKAPCEYQFLKKIDDSGVVIQSTAKLDLRPNKVCITASDVLSLFKTASYEIHQYSANSNIVAYNYNDRGLKISFMLIERPQNRSCFESIYLSQLYRGDHEHH